MLHIKVSIWPGGSRQGAHEVGSAGYANVSRLAEISDYVVVMVDATGERRDRFVRGHRRRDGFWQLIARACAPDCEPVPDEWLEVSTAIARRLLVASTEDT